jgi:hypothetical protein
LAMPRRAPGDVIRYANVQRTEWPVRHDVDPTATHGAMLDPPRLRKLQRSSVMFRRRMRGRNRRGNATFPLPPSTTRRVMARSSRAMTGTGRGGCRMRGPLA